jgi:hypothetical protein
MKRILNRVIPIVQFGGALSALVAISPLLAKFSPDLSVVMNVSVIYALGVIGGIFLWQNYRIGAVLSIIHQILILPRVSIPEQFSYDLDDIFYFEIGMMEEEGGSKLNFDIGAQFGDITFLFGPNVTQTISQINAVSVVIIIYLILKWNDLDGLVRAADVKTDVPFDDEK